MNLSTLSLAVIFTSILSNCKKKEEGSIGYLTTVFDKSGYAINDANRSLQMIADDGDGSLALMRDTSVLFTFNADFSKVNEEFWKSSKLSHGSLRLGAIINDYSIDGIPDDITLIGNDKFKGKFKLGTYIINDSGVPVAQIISSAGKIRSIDISEQDKVSDK